MIIKSVGPVGFEPWWYVGSDPSAQYSKPSLIGLVPQLRSNCKLSTTEEQKMGHYTPIIIVIQKRIIFLKV